MAEQEENLLLDDCQICFEKIGEDYMTLDCCGQNYHSNCIKEWLKVSKYKTCPHCRKKVKDYEKIIGVIEQPEVNEDIELRVREINKIRCICCCRAILFLILFFCYFLYYPTVEN